MIPGEILGNFRGCPGAYREVSCSKAREYASVTGRPPPIISMLDLANWEQHSHFDTHLGKTEESELRARLSLADNDNLV